MFLGTFELSQPFVQQTNLVSSLVHKKSVHRQAPTPDPSSTPDPSIPLLTLSQHIERLEGQFIRQDAEHSRTLETIRAETTKAVDALEAQCRDLRARVALLETGSNTGRSDTGHLSPASQGYRARSVGIEDFEEEDTDQVGLSNSNVEGPALEGEYLSLRASVSSVF